MEKFVKTLSAEQAVSEINSFREISEKKNMKNGSFIEVNLKVRINSNFTKINCGKTTIIKGSSFIKVTTFNYSKNLDLSEEMTIVYEKDTFFDNCYQRTVTFEEQ